MWGGERGLSCQEVSRNSFLLFLVDSVHASLATYEKNW